MPADSPLDRLRALLPRTARNARVPYSRNQQAAVVLLQDGNWVPGVRVESASFSLVIPALLNAVTTAVAADRPNIVAVVLDHDRTSAEDAFVEAIPYANLDPVGPDAYALDGRADLPPLGSRLHPFLDAPTPATPNEGVRRARSFGERAYVPQSQFPVSCVMQLTDGRLLPGVNVEHTDWSRILCAERTVLGTAVTYGRTDFDALYLTCLHDPKCTPCGACRQLLLELAPECTLWMDRGDEAPERTRPSDLLPGGFTGDGLAASRAVLP